MRVIALAMLAALLGLTATSRTVTAEDDTLAAISDDDWKEFSEAVKARDDYAPRHSLRQDVMEAKIAGWEKAWGVRFSMEWVEYFESSNTIAKTGQKTMTNWSVTRERVRSADTYADAWVVNHHSYNGDKENWSRIVSDAKMAELNFSYLSSIRQVSPLDADAGELDYSNGTSAVIAMRKLCDSIDADYVLPSGDNPVALHLRDNTVREAMEKIAAAAGWKLHFTGGLEAGAPDIRINSVITMNAIRPKAGGDPETDLPATLRDQLARDRVEMLEGGICVTAEEKE